ncbi:MAG: Asd/ArgC dimerization domain-containing protein [Candidatus Acidiferrales bacterium]
MTLTLRIAIAGAASLRGKEVASVIEESGFPPVDLRLFDDEVAEGVLTEAGGEPVVIRSVDEDSFAGVRFAFFTGSPAFTLRHWRQAAGAGATVIDLSGALRTEPGFISWIPALRSALATPRMAAGKLYHSPPAAVIIASTIAAAVRAMGVTRLAIVLFQPVSERGQAGIEELEKQTVNLLSLQPLSQDLYGAQIAFNLLGSYGSEGMETLAGVKTEIVASVAAYLEGRARLPAIQVVQAPVFHGYAFSAFAEFDAPREPADLETALQAAGVKIAAGAGEEPNNVRVAGEDQIVVGRIERDANFPASLWMWGAADNLRLAAANAVSIAETLLAS